MPDRPRVYAATHIGYLRTSNEDRCGTPEWQTSGTNETWQGSVERVGGWLVVADGMGGHGAGEVASDIAVNTLARRLPAMRSNGQIAGAITAANHAVHDAMSAPGGLPAMGTTIVGIRLGLGGGTIFNVGDSRAYLLRGEALRMLSLDHTPLICGASGSRSHALTQSLGGTLARRVLMPHFANVVTVSGDQILLCSDGLTDLVSDDRIQAILCTVPTHPADELVAAALDAGGRDNVTVAVLTL